MTCSETIIAKEAQVQIINYFIDWFCIEELPNGARNEMIAKRDSLKLEIEGLRGKIKNGNS